MKQALREALGKAAYEARCKHLSERAEAIGERPFKGPTWEESRDEAREFYCVEAEAAVMAFCGLIASLAQLAVNLLDQVFDAEEIERLAATPLDLDRLRYDEHKEPA